jgi:phosphate transport system protein
MTDHTSKDYDEALEHARELVGLMAARVERQLADAIESLQSGSSALIDQILRHEAEVNGLERSIDEFTGQIIARRQPAARDLRLLMALLGATTDLERVGDESKKIALYARSLHSAGRALITRVAELRPMAELVRLMLRSATQALDSLEPGGAAGLVRRDLEANQGFRAVLARLAGIMVEDPRTISACLDILFVAKSLERIGDHCKNIGEHVVYAAMGKDVRHASAQEIEQAVRS